MNRTNFEAIIRTERKREKAMSDEFMPKGRKLNKTKRGGGVKGSFRSMQEDSKVNQEKYFIA